MTPRGRTHTGRKRLTDGNYRNSLNKEHQIRKNLSWVGGSSDEPTSERVLLSLRRHLNRRPGVLKTFETTNCDGNVKGGGEWDGRGPSVGCGWKCQETILVLCSLTQETQDPSFTVRHQETYGGSEPIWIGRRILCLFVSRVLITKSYLRVNDKKSPRCHLLNDRECQTSTHYPIMVFLDNILENRSLSSHQITGENSTLVWTVHYITKTPESF